MKDNLDQVAQRVLDLAVNKGGLQAEVFLLDSREMTLEVAQKEVENMKIAQERGLGLRIIAKGRLGYAYTSDLSSPALVSVVEKAVHNSRETQPDDSWEFPGQFVSCPSLDIYDKTIFEVPIEEKIELAKKIEESARNYDRRVVITEKAVYQDSCYRVLICNSLGLSGNYMGAYCGGYAVVVGQENDESQTGFGMQFGLKYKEIDPQAIGREAGERAVRMLGSKTIPSGKMPVVIEPYTATNFLGVLQTAFSGEAVLKGKSFYKGQTGQQVANSLVTIIDDGTMPAKLGSSPFDGEGIPTTRTLLIDQGRLTGLLHNGYTARKTGGRSTGNSVRSSYKNTPEVGITNFYLKEGDRNREDIIKEVKRGLYLTDVLGMHTANPVTGDFSLGAAGMLIENGEFTIPVKGIAIAGNLKEMLQDVDALGNDLMFFIGKGAPTVRIKVMSISG